MSYFLKYVIDNEWLGPRGQVVLGVLLGAGLVAWSALFVRRGLGYFGDGLAGLGAAVIYLSLWAGSSYYRFIPAEVGFAAMIVVTAAMLAIALGRNSQSVAVLAMIGGFLTPWLVGTGRDAQVGTVPLPRPPQLRAAGTGACARLALPGTARVSVHPDLFLGLV